MKTLVFFINLSLFAMTSCFLIHQEDENCNDTLIPTNHYIRAYLKPQKLSIKILNVENEMFYLYMNFNGKCINYEPDILLYS